MRNAIATIVVTAGVIALVLSSDLGAKNRTVPAELDLPNAGQIVQGGGKDRGADPSGGFASPPPPPRDVEAAPRTKTINGRLYYLAAEWTEGGRRYKRWELVGGSLASHRSLTAPATGYYDGASRWTYPGRIDSHLASSHGVSSSEIAGKSKAELEAMHDALHNRASTRRVMRRSPVRVLSSGCPGGVCPSPGSFAPMRRGLFRRF
jgi:hypothetical protein